MSDAIRLLASDIDGTLVHAGGPPSRRTFDALRAAQRAGVMVVLVTGRAPRSARLVAEQLGVHGPAVCANGALIVELPALRLLRDIRIEGSLASRLVEEVSSALPGVVFAWDRGLEWGREAGWPAGSGGQAMQLPGGVIGDVGPEAARGLSKLICYLAGVPPDEVVRIVRGVLAGRAEVSTATSPPLAEITARGHDKREALEWLCHSLHVRRAEVLAIGDAPNDLPMLTWAGRGVAMGNAHESVLASTTEHTGRHDEDGFAAVVEELLSTLPASRRAQPDVAS